MKTQTHQLDAVSSKAELITDYPTHFQPSEDWVERMAATSKGSTHPRQCSGSQPSLAHQPCPRPKLTLAGCSTLGEGVVVEQTELSQG